MWHVPGVSIGRLMEAENMTRNFNPGGGPMRRAALALAAVLALNPGAAPAAGAAAKDAEAAAVRGALVIQSEPAGANVYVDGRLAGHTPLQVGSLTPGDHRVRVVKDGYLENARIVSVGTTPKNVLVTLTPHTATSKASAEQLSGGGGAGGPSKWLWIGLAGGGAVAAALVLANRNSAPEAGSVVANPTTGLAASTAIVFTAQGANDPDDDALTFNWNFGDGSSATGERVTKTYANAGTFNVSLEVSDGKKTATAAGSVTIRSLTGNWLGTINTLNARPFTMMLTQSGAAITGNYFDSAGSGNVTGTVSAGNAVTLFVVQPGFERLTFQGLADSGVNNVNGTVPTGFTGGTPTFTMRR
jgi:hypothetical protein